MSVSDHSPVLCAIVAIARNNIIGHDNTLIWHLPEDLKHFKRTTLGKPVLMGRKSYESIGKPLPGRPNIVISRSQQITPDAPTSEDGPFFAPTIEDGIKLMRDMAQKLQTDEIFITGGGEIYRQTLPQVKRLYLTVLDRDYDGDTSFPALDWSQWRTLSQTAYPAEPDKDRPSFTVFTLERA